MTLLRYFLTIVAVLGLNTALFAQRRMERKSCDQEQPDPRCQSVKYSVPDCALSNQVPAAYNMSARIDPDKSYDVSLDASFIYWNVCQGYMDIGRTALFASAGAPSTPAANGAVVIHPTEYQPGFQIGLGFGSNFDDWQFGTKYTFLRHSSTENNGSSATSFAAGDEIIVPNEWFIDLSLAHQEQAGKMTSKWKMHLDMLDALLSRPFYQGQRVNVTPYAGLKALWVRQLFKVTMDFARDTTQSANSTNRSQGWGLGPNIGANANWLLGMGFRIEANAGMSLLYMRYTKITHTENFPTAFSGGLNPLNGHYPAYGYLRAVNEAGLGFGWGTYCYDKRFHVDFSARYDFSLFWEQNMMRYGVGGLANNNVGYSNPMGNLYLHGLTLSGKFDF